MRLVNTHCTVGSVRRKVCAYTRQQKHRNNVLRVGLEPTIPLLRAAEDPARLRLRCQCDQSLFFEEQHHNADRVTLACLPPEIFMPAVGI
jgi:hypothetical protein